MLDIWYKNYLRTSKRYYTDTWKFTGEHNYNFFKTIVGDNLLINSNIKGLAAIDNYPSLNFLNKKNKKVLTKLQNSNYFEIYKKNKFEKSYFGSSILIQFRYFLKIKRLIKSKSNILIIGDGYGILSSIILNTFNCKIFLCDLPETLMLQEYYLRKNFPKLKMNYVANDKDKINFDSKINFINCNQIHRFNIKLDLVINLDSMSEMDKSSIDNYYKFVEKNLKIDGYFFNSNPGGVSGQGYRLPGNYPLTKRFIIKDLEVMYPSHRDVFFKYLSVLAQKKVSIHKDISNNKLDKIRNKTINYFYNESENIININNLKIIKKKTIDIANLIIKKNYKNKIFKAKNKLLKSYQIKENFSQKINNSNFYHKFMLNFLKFLDRKKLGEFDEYCKYFLKIKKPKVEISDAVKIIALSRFKDPDLSIKFMHQISEDSFEKLYLKFALLENLDNKKRDHLLINLEKLKSNQFLDQLKFLYCCFKLDKDQKAYKQIKKIKLKINSKLFAIYFLKLLIVAGKFEIFNKNFNFLAKKFKIHNDDKINILLSTCFVEPKTIKRFKMIFKNEKINESNKLDQIVLGFKIGAISEKNFIAKIVKNYRNYYSIGFVLKNTIKHLDLKNVRFLCSESLKLKSNEQNINFISEILFYNQMYNDCFKKASKIKDLHKYSIFYNLKKILSKVAIKDKFFKDHICELTKKDFFRLIHNGRVCVLPFMDNGNNAVQISGN